MKNGRLQRFKQLYLPPKKKELNKPQPLQSFLSSPECCHVRSETIHDWLTFKGKVRMLRSSERCEPYCFKRIWSTDVFGTGHRSTLFLASSSARNILLREQLKLFIGITSICDSNSFTTDFLRVNLSLQVSNWDHSVESLTG